MKSELHEFQISILRELLFKPKSRFRDLKKYDIENHHFNFHLKSLVAGGYVVKELGKYSLSTAGKEFANRIDTDSLLMEKQAKIAVALHPIRTINRNTEYLIQKRLKEPFFGWYGSISGKIKWGETPLDCARRELMEETGLSGDFKMKGVVHYNDFDLSGKLLEDKYFFVFEIKNLSGTLISKFEGGENIWMTRGKYEKLENVFASFNEITRYLNSNTLVYEDRKKIRSSY